MGIHGLLPLLKSTMSPIHVKELEGRRVAVDTYSWLHKGALSCSKDLCFSLPTTRHIDYCMHRVNLLRHHGVKPILVFDGGFLPMKNEQEIKRARARKENLERAIEHESIGNSAAAYECYQKAVDISPSVAYELIQVLKQENVDYVVAPYEADAQMTFLALSNFVDAVITEDSDLIAFGCPRIVFKMDKFGQGVQFQYSMLQRNVELDFTGFTKQMVLEMCIFSGCDYLQSLPGMGLKRAHALIRRFRSYSKVIKHLRYNTSSVPPLYEESFKKALWTFQYQRVYDSTKEDIVHLADVPEDLGHDLDFLGPLIPQDTVKGIARGELDPITKLPFKVENVHNGPVLHRMYSDKNFQSEMRQNKLDLPAKKNVLTNYFCTASHQAKKAFRAPRAMPKCLDLANASPYSDGDVPKQPSSSSPNELLGPLLNTGNLSITTNSNSEENGFSVEIPPAQPLVGNSRSTDRVAYLKQSTQAVCKPCVMMRKSRENKSEFNGVDIKTRSMGRKVVTSRYFKQKVLNVDKDEGSSNEELNSRDDSANDGDCENIAPESSSIRSEDVKGVIKKRKLSSISGTQDEDTEVKNAWETSTSDDTKKFESKSAEADTNDKKFGSNISHVNYYSEVAEKSMERFLSAINSFKYNSDGSRASGLRAPLKDVRNMQWTRSTNMQSDISKFSYLPNQKRSSGTRRG
ncbi:hypothetical protein Scep_027328 [Stephania cephalantha]|uniref:Exonuclease 1 n=1 Tax=Stephania cephalantha TaxID=152367 RepID=A0AAP0HKZ4_9MAGN